MVLVGLQIVSIHQGKVDCVLRNRKGSAWESTTYEWKPAVFAWADLRFVNVDVDLGVSKRTTPSVTAHDALARPANGLLVY